MRNYLKGGFTMEEKTKKTEERVILTSANCPELARKIKEASKKYMVRNYNIYKALENK